MDHPANSFFDPARIIFATPFPSSASSRAIPIFWNGYFCDFFIPAEANKRGTDNTNSSSSQFNVISAEEHRYHLHCGALAAIVGEMLVTDCIARPSSRLD